MSRVRVQSSGHKKSYVGYSQINIALRPTSKLSLREAQCLSTPSRASKHEKLAAKCLF